MPLPPFPSDTQVGKGNVVITRAIYGDEKVLEFYGGYYTTSETTDLVRINQSQQRIRRTERKKKKKVSEVGNNDAAFCTQRAFLLLTHSAILGSRLGYALSVS